MTIRRCALWSVLVAGLAAQVVLAAPERASAQFAPTRDTNPTPKGTVGLGLIGAEVGLLIPALCGLRKTWALVTFPLVGAAGGAVAGYFALDHARHDKAAVSVLVTGLALVMPTIVGSVAALRHRRDKELESSQSAARARALAMAGPGAVRLVDGRLALGAPGIGVSPAFTRDELARYGGVASNTLQIALFSGAF